MKNVDCHEGPKLKDTKEVPLVLSVRLAKNSAAVTEFQLDKCRNGPKKLLSV